jgi:hypothetical protein
VTGHDRDGRYDAGRPAAVRLARRVRGDTDAYRDRLEADAAAVTEQVARGDAEAASQTVTDHLAALEVYREVVRAAVNEALCEREAERVVAGAADALGADDAGIAGGVGRGPEVLDDSRGGDDGPAVASGRGRGLAVAVAGSSLALVLGLGVAAADLGTSQATGDTEAAERHLAAADRFLQRPDVGVSPDQGVAATLRRLHDHVLAVPDSAFDHDGTRERVEALLAREQRLLESVAATDPARAAQLARESRAVHAAITPRLDEAGS